MPEQDWPKLLTEQIRGFGRPLGAVRDSLDQSAQINYRPLEKLLLPPPWYNGVRPEYYPDQWNRGPMAPW